MSANDDRHGDELPQIDKFKEAARELGVDEDESRWEERLRKVANHKPKEEKPAD